MQICGHLGGAHKSEIHIMTDTPIGEYFTHFFGGYEIAQRSKDGYIDATAMCKVKNGKKFTHWRNNKTTESFLEMLSVDTGISIVDLYDIKRGGDDRGGSWIHPYASIHLAMWINPIFAIKVIKWTSRFISGDRRFAAQVIEIADRISCSTTITTSTTVPKRLIKKHKREVCELHTAISVRHIEAVQTDVSNLNLFLQTFVEHTDAGLVAQSKFIGAQKAVDHLMQEMEKYALVHRHEERDVYFIRIVGTKLVKVGFSGDVFQRMKQLKTANPFDLVLEYTHSTTKYAQLERELHKICNATKVSGEWFEMGGDTDYRALVKSAILKISKVK